jgi:predicted AAA+ superfamily ATPase
MITRFAEQEIAALLKEFPAVGLLGPRQVGKTTLAEAVSTQFVPTPLYLDLETPSDLAKLSEPEAYFELYPDRLIILDEVQRAPELFPILRGVIDRRRRQGFRTGQFLILGSASLDLLQQSSESLAGRIAYKQLSGLNILETFAAGDDDINKLWLRGGFPESYLAASGAASFRWRSNFISTYLERDVPQLGPRIPTVTLRRLWTMLAHTNGGPVNYSQLAASLGVASVTVKRYVELLEDLLLLRSLRPWSGNIEKRLVRTPKVYVRDSGLIHALLNLKTLDDLLGSPVAGPSWEGFVIENIISCLREGMSYWYYRTAAGAEIDLVLEIDAKTRFAIEIKRSLAPTVSKGFYLGCDDVQATKRFVVYPGKEMFPMGNGTVATPLGEMMKLIEKENGF